MKNQFKALIVREEDTKFVAQIETFSVDDLPEGEVLIKVEYSSLNFKDALSYSGNKGITKKYPHVIGIDAAGVVESCSTGQFKSGEKVICTGYDLGMNTWGGMSEYIRVPAEWVVSLPEGLSAKEAMTYGTSGFTAAQSLYNFEMVGAKGSVLVSGATGAVGSMAVALLSKAGYEVIAATRSDAKIPFLQKLGASSIVSTSELLEKNPRPLASGKYDNAVDTVGGVVLENILKTVKYRGAVTCCGMIDSPNLETSVFPFILRGLKLIGIDSAECPLKIKKEIWSKLANEWRPDCLGDIPTEIELEEVTHHLDLMLQGKTYGKVVVKVSN